MQSCRGPFYNYIFPWLLWNKESYKNHSPRKSVNYFSSSYSPLKRSSFLAKLNNHSFLSPFSLLLWVYAFQLLGLAEVRRNGRKLLGIILGSSKCFRFPLLKSEICLIKRKGVLGFPFTFMWIGHNSSWLRINTPSCSGSRAYLYVQCVSFTLNQCVYFIL